MGRHGWGILDPRSLIVITLGLGYLFTVNDLISDLAPGGFLDDLIVIPLVAILVLGGGR